jgi:hypothetical protein
MCHYKREMFVWLNPFSPIHKTCIIELLTIHSTSTLHLSAELQMKTAYISSLRSAVYTLRCVDDLSSHVFLSSQLCHCWIAYILCTNFRCFYQREILIWLASWAVMFNNKIDLYPSNCRNLRRKALQCPGFFPKWTKPAEYNCIQ